MNRPTRRDLLAGVAAGALAPSSGCLDRAATDDENADPRGEHSPGRTDGNGVTGTAPGSTTPSPTSGVTGTPLGSATPPPGECTATPPPKPKTGSGNPDPRSYPDRPETLSTDAVRSFLTDYERTYAANKTLAGIVARDACVDGIWFEVRTVEVEAAGNGYRGTVETFGSYDPSTCPEYETARTATIYSTELTTSGSYALSPRFLARNGTVRECWE